MHGNIVDPETGLRVKARAVGETPFKSDAAAAKQRSEAEEAGAGGAVGEADAAEETEAAEEALLRAALLDIEPRAAPRRAAPPRNASIVVRDALSRRQDPAHPVRVGGLGGTQRVITPA